MFGVQLLNYGARNLDNVIIGFQLGPQQLGFYSRAYALFLLPLQQLNGPLGRVALPVLSTLRDDPARFRNYIRGAVLVIGYLTLPSYAVAAAVSAASPASLSGLREASATCTPCFVNRRASEAESPLPTPTIKAVFASIIVPRIPALCFR